MDVNARPPAQWISPDGPYELADHCIENKTNLLVLLNAWLDSGTQDNGELITEESTDSNGEAKEGTSTPDRQTLNFWAARLWPLWRRGTRPKGSTNGTAELDGHHEDGIMQQTQDGRSHETIVVACNRTGEENGMFQWLQHLISTNPTDSQASSLRVPRQCLECALRQAAQSFFIRWGDAMKVCTFGKCLSNRVRFPHP
jgi:hypothetical protein